MVKTNHLRLWSQSHETHFQIYFWFVCSLFPTWHVFHIVDISLYDFYIMKFYLVIVERWLTHTSNLMVLQWTWAWITASINCLTTDSMSSSREFWQGLPASANTVVSQYTHTCVQKKTFIHTKLKKLNKSFKKVFTLKYPYFINKCQVYVTKLFGF